MLLSCSTALSGRQWYDKQNSNSLSFTHKAFCDFYPWLSPTTIQWNPNVYISYHFDLHFFYLLTVYKPGILTPTLCILWFYRSPSTWLKSLFSGTMTSQGRCQTLQEHHHGSTCFLPHPNCHLLAYSSGRQWRGNECSSVLYVN